MAGETRRSFAMHSKSAIGIFCNVNGNNFFCFSGFIELIECLICSGAVVGGCTVEAITSGARQAGSVGTCGYRNCSRCSYG